MTRSVLFLAQCKDKLLNRFKITAQREDRVKVQYRKREVKRKRARDMEAQKKIRERGTDIERQREHRNSKTDRGVITRERNRLINIK